MLIKWIICTVPESRRDAFGEAQQAWQSLGEVDGFLGQTGGWHVDDPTQACIMGLWKHPGAYQTFMREIHDTVTDQSGQESMYESSRISLYDWMFDIPGKAASLIEACTSSTILRIAECIVHSHRQSHFVRMQQEVWNPGMSRHEAMMGGLFTRNAQEADRFLVATWWRNRQGYDDYVRTTLPELREKASVEGDVRSLDGKIIAIDPAWWVPPAG